MAALLALSCPWSTNPQPETGREDTGEFWTLHAKCLQATSFTKLGF